MAATPSFQEIIEADRKKRKAEALAASIFGRNKTNNLAPGRKGPVGGSLASRVGIVKRTASTSSIPSVTGRTNVHVPNKPAGNVPSRRPRPSLPSSLSASAADAPRATRLHASLNNGRPAKGTPLRASTSALPSATATNAASSASMSIRGIATSTRGPFVVMASNFAPGTTAADIQAAMEPMGGEVLQCRLLSAHPTVLCEIVFKEREGAENVIATFNNQKADGRLLYVYLKQGGPTPDFSISSQPQAQLQKPAPINSTDLYAQAPRGNTASRSQSHRNTPQAIPVVDSTEELMDIDDEAMDDGNDFATSVGGTGAQSQQSYNASNSSRPRERDEGRLDRPRADDLRGQYRDNNNNSRSSRSGGETRGGEGTAPAIGFYEDRTGNATYQEQGHGQQRGGYGGGYERRGGGGGGGRYGGYGQRYDASRSGGGGYGGGGRARGY